MKLKYYLRGLAVGVIMTTIILTIANADNKPMTDAQIRQRALELGMIESDSLKLSDVAESGRDESIAVSGSEIGNTESEASETTTEIMESTSSAADGAASPSRPPASTEDVPESSEPSVSDSAEPIIITIKSGDSSYSVSKILAAAGLVEDAAEYDNYLCDNGYSRKIRTGTYEIFLGMSYEEIARTITR